jgi:transketolase
MSQFLVSNNDYSFPSKLSSTELSQLADIYRINCLGGLLEANRGWLGASFSAIDILTNIYHTHILEPKRPISGRPSVILSKGHAAMAHYAILAGFNMIPTEKLLKYKVTNELPAHSDRNTPGVDADSGSLGQGLSKALGVALRNKDNGSNHPCFVIIGDGELQEGQLFESFLTLKKWNLTSCIPIIDRNFLQSDSQTNDIKDAKDWSQVFKGIGLNVIEINGHDQNDISKGMNQALTSDLASVIIATTSKGGGTKVTSMSKDTERRQGVWHGGIPDSEQAIDMIDELVGRINLPTISEKWTKYRQNFPKKTASAPSNSKSVSTGQCFGKILAELATSNSNLYFLDADLEKSCRLTELAQQFPDRFLEVGISEQDMTSIAAGIGLNGGIPVVNTYASFYKRSLDQIFACVTEKVPVIFAGHYSGIDYFTDGKSHQSVNDIGLLRAIGGIDIFEPVNELQTRQILEYLIARYQNEISNGQKSRPAYIRLHRTPSDFCAGLSTPFIPSEPILFNSSNKEAKSSLFVSGPHMLATALKVQDHLESDNLHINVVSITHLDDSNKKIKTLLQDCSRAISFESHNRTGGLGSFLSELAFTPVARVGVKNYCQSSRTFEDMINQHDLSATTLCQVVKKVLSCED